MHVATITIGIDPTIELGPLTIAWHGLTIALGIVAGGLLAAGRFAEFFVRSDSDALALGLETAQWTSLALLVACAVGAWLTIGRPGVRG